MNLKRKQWVRCNELSENVYLSKNIYISNNANSLLTTWCRVESKGNPRWLNRPFSLMFFKSLYSFVILWHANFTLMNVPVMKAIQYSLFFFFFFWVKIHSCKYKNNKAKCYWLHSQMKKFSGSNWYFSRIYFVMPQTTSFFFFFSFIFFLWKYIQLEEIRSFMFNSSSVMWILWFVWIRKNKKDGNTKKFPLL